MRRGVALLGKADLAVEISDEVIGISGASAFVDLQFVHGPRFSDRFVGDTQVVSNIDASSALRPFEAWVRLPFKVVGGEAATTVGLIDLNGAFDIQRTGALFINSSHGIGPDFSQSGPNGPSIFPTTSLTVVTTFDRKPWSVRLGVFDALAGDPARTRRTVLRAPGKQGLLLIAEVDRAIGPVELQVGGWLYTDRFEALTETDTAGQPRSIRGNRGAYAQVENRFARRDDGVTLDGWIRLGVAQARINPIGVYIGGGLAYGAERRRVGLAVAHARLGGPGAVALRRAGENPTAAETIVELTYSHTISRRLRLQPDLQYVRNPSFRREVGDAVVLGLEIDVF